MTTTTVRQLVKNITTANTWTQLTEGAGGSAYSVPSSGRADIKLLSANNLGANDTIVEFAVSTNNTIADEERIWPSLTIKTGEFASDDSIHVMRTGEGLWARATGTSPNITFNASILEVV